MSVNDTNFNDLNASHDFGRGLDKTELGDETHELSQYSYDNDPMGLGKDYNDLKMKLPTLADLSKMKREKDAAHFDNDK